MQYKISEIVEVIRKWAPEDLQEEWDNSGYQIGFKDKNTSNVIIAMDLTDNVVNEAIKNNSKLIITHHPLFFNSIKSIVDNEYMGKNIVKLIRNEISLYSAHTSLDIADGGVNHKLLKELGFNNYKELSLTDKNHYLGLYAYNDKNYTFNELLNKLKTINKDLKIYGRVPNKITKIAVCGGSGFDLIDDVINADAEVFITGDIKHHQSQTAYENDICLIDLGHFNSEVLILDEIEKRLKKEFDIEIYKYTINDFKVEY